jgi:hypothetical protein
VHPGYYSQKSIFLKIWARVHWKSLDYFSRLFTCFKTIASEIVDWYYRWALDSLATDLTGGPWTYWPASTCSRKFASPASIPAPQILFFSENYYISLLRVLK